MKERTMTTKTVNAKPANDPDDMARQYAERQEVQLNAFTPGHWRKRYPPHACAAVFPMTSDRELDARAGHQRERSAGTDGDVERRDRGADLPVGWSESAGSGGPHP